MKKIFKIILLTIFSTIFLTSCTLNINLPKKEDSSESSQSSIEEFSDNTSSSSISSEKSGSSATTSESSSTRESSSTNLSGLTFSFNQAYSLFKETFPNDKLEDVELDKNNENFVWTLKGNSNSEDHKMKINGSTGEVTHTETEKDYTNESDLFLMDNLITPEEAIAIAFTKATGEFDSLDLEKDDGYIKYTVDIGNWDIEINAETGDIIKIDD